MHSETQSFVCAMYTVGPPSYKLVYEPQKLYSCIVVTPAKKMASHHIVTIVIGTILPYTIVIGVIGTNYLLFFLNVAIENCHV